MNHLLEKYQQQRFDWAFEAKDDYLNQFTVFEDDGKKLDSKRLVISVYGPTQVGKSTLILTLLGVKNEYIAEISKFLRGKRETGESSTITVTIYQISTTNQFQIKIPKEPAQTVETPEQLEEQLASLRGKIEKGILHSVDPVIIAIPRYMFDNPELSLEIIDLPGIESAEQREVEYVKRCVTYWIPNSHVCLIVNAANDLTFLRDIEMPQLMQWYDYENNYFLILTRALTPSSVKKAIREGDLETSQDVIEHYKQNLEDILHHRKGKVFPIEIGDSFKKLNATELTLAMTMLDELKLCLLDIDIQKISFNYLSSYHRDVLKQEQIKLSALTEDIQSKEKYIKELEANETSATKKVTEQLESFKETSEFVHKRQREINQVYLASFTLKQHEADIESLVKNSEITKKASGLNRLFSNILIELEEKLNESIQKLNTYYQDITNELGISKMAMPSLMSMSFTYWDTSRIDSYFSEKNYLKQKSSMEWHFKQLVKETLEDIHEHKERLDERLLDGLNDAKRHVRRQELVLQVNNTEYEELLTSEKNALVQLNERFSELQKLWENDKQHALQYKQFFVQHFIDRKNELLEMSTSSNLEDNYLASLFLTVLGPDAQKIIDSMELDNYDKSENSK